MPIRPSSRSAFLVAVFVVSSVAVACGGSTTGATGLQADRAAVRASVAAGVPRGALPVAARLGRLPREFVGQPGLEARGSHSACTG